MEEKQTIDEVVFSKIRERRDFTRVAVKLLPRQRMACCRRFMPGVNNDLFTNERSAESALYFYSILSHFGFIAGFNWFCLLSMVIVTSLIMFTICASGKEEGTTMMDDVVHAIKSTTSATIHGSDKRQDKLIESICRFCDDTISITTPPGEMSSETSFRRNGY